MEDDAPVIYGLEFQARALTPQTAETDAIRFLVGTQSLKYDNQIHIIDFDDENNIINKNVLLHQVGEIWHISASPADKGVLATCYNKIADSRVLTCAAVWRMPEESEPGSHESPDESSSTAHALELLCDLDGVAAHGSVACVVWEPTGDGTRVISLADNHLLLWDLQASSSRALLASSASLEGKGQLRFTSGRWSPHHNCTQVATANDTAVRGWDTRSMRSTAWRTPTGSWCGTWTSTPTSSTTWRPAGTTARSSSGTRATSRSPCGAWRSTRTGCGTSAITTRTTSWSSRAAATAGSSSPTWCPSPPSPSATWWTTTT
ncbi:EARP and GARP complex-interacting protein 1 isoform X3 [Myotis yumanensis]|uniref:EARP and GARP complex-interacting protein 1 isoform X3 n=1 Tax=Myotis yumanensis TaxID=159337 RepID=UPI0038D3E844